MVEEEQDNWQKQLESKKRQKRERQKQQDQHVDCGCPDLEGREENGLHVSMDAVGRGRVRDAAVHPVGAQWGVERWA